MNSIFEVDAVAVFSTIILIATIVTIIFAITAYVISIYRRKKPQQQQSKQQEFGSQQGKPEIKPAGDRILKPYNPFEEHDKGGR
jgi:cytochrome bd-type quinol oxidase subunit 1